MTEKTKLKLQIIDNGETKVTHHFYFDVCPENTLKLTIGNIVYDLDSKGNIIKNE